MKVFLVRHSDALADTEDARRLLSAEGIRITRDVAGCLKGSGAVSSVRAVWHSPLSRARETAELMVGELGLDVLLVEAPGLLPEDDPAAIADRLEDAGHPVMIVGHEPQLGALATLLVRGKTKPVAFAFRKTAVLAREGRRTPQKSGRLRWQARWFFSPELLSSRPAPDSPH